MIRYSKNDREIIQENTFEQKKKSGLELYPRLELIGLLSIDLFSCRFCFPIADHVILH